MVMLSELGGMQESNENVWSISMSFDIETRSGDGDEIVHRTYTFGYAREWEKWTFHEFKEKRTKDTTRMSDRNWRQSRHIMWHEVNETPTVEVPPEVADELQQATGAESIVIQVPSGGIKENTYEELYIADD
mgnify:CR=1 FL=1